MAASNVAARAIPSSRRGTRSRLADASGAALIEFAICLPVLLLLVAGIIDFGFAFREYEALTNAAREGARMAVLPGYDNVADIEQRVKAYLSAAEIAEIPTVQVLSGSVPLDFGAPLKTKIVIVKLHHTYTLLGPVASLVGGTFGTIEMKATSEMRIEVPAGGT